MAYFLTKLFDRLEPDEVVLLRAAVHLAKQTRETLYVVGGTVRDLLLDKRQVDIDLVTEGEALALSRSLAERLGAQCHVYERFGTATVLYKDSHLDIARTRAERYPRAGALPQVRPAGLLQDLARRDFTINAIAMPMNGPCAGKLIDPHKGQQDLTQQLIRVLHDGSFRDDPTRLFRAVRYMGRYGFRLEPHTRALVSRDLNGIQHLSAKRIRREFERMLVEPRSANVFRIGQREGLFAALDSPLSVSPRQRAAIERNRREGGTHDSPVLWCLLLWQVSARHVDATIRQLGLRRREAKALESMVSIRSKSKALGRLSSAPSRIAALLDEEEPDAVVAVSLLCDDSVIRERARRYLHTWSRTKPLLQPGVLPGLGVPSGPPVGDALRMLRAARLDGKVRSRAEEKSLVTRWLQRRRRQGSRRA